MIEGGKLIGAGAESLYGERMSGLLIDSLQLLSHSLPKIPKKMGMGLLERDSKGKGGTGRKDQKVH